MNLKLNTGSKKIIVEVICLLYILLFVYAAISKLLDFENFQVQLGQSPLFGAFASWVSWLVPITEIIISFLLCLPRFRKFGLIFALALMTMFTSYIFIIMHFSSFVPCSCGGILEKMSWNVHLGFNIFFIILVICAILFLPETKHSYFQRRLRLVRIVFTMLLGIVTVVVLFVSSEKIMHSENPFQRIYPPHPAEFLNSIDLSFNSYYLAGYSGNRIYLGNYTTPSQIMSLDINLKDQRMHKILFEPGRIPFKIIRSYVRGNYFYLLDGSVPKIFRGNLNSWKINTELLGSPYFSKAIPIDSNTVVVRTNKNHKFENVLGILNSGQVPKFQYLEKLLQAQNDGIFDTDGTLLYSEDSQKIVYLYFYRNEFLVADKNGLLEYRGNTIDTIKRAKIKVASLKNGTEYAISSPFFVVNSTGSVFRNLLFVHSTVKGKLENEKFWEKSFVIDVYDLSKKNYLFSFPIYHIKEGKLNSFVINKTRIYALIGNELAMYEIKNGLKKEIDLYK